MEQLSAAQIAEIARAVFAARGGGLPVVIASLAVELSERCNALEQRMAALEAKRR
jgi:hypothetical protein